MVNVLPRGWLQEMSQGHKVLRACCQGNITAVFWCVFILSASSPRAGAPLTTVLPAGSLRQKCFNIYIFIYIYVVAHRQHRHKKHWHRHADTTNTNLYAYIHTCTHIITLRKLTSCSRSAVKCCFASPSLHPLPPLLSSPLLVSLTPKDKETHCTMGHHLSPQEQLLETFHCQKISSQFFPQSLSLYLPPPALSLCLSFLPCCHLLFFLPSSTLPLCMTPNELYCRSDSH